MPMAPTWTEIAVRLLLTVLAGSLIGINREIGGHTAGFRTTVLVGVAASLAMIQANILLTTVGKTEASFSVMDTLRLPLGVLTGVGFIGGGAILKRGDMVSGVTTAATLWIITAIGLCIGGGQVLIGCSGAIIALIVLSPLKVVDDWLPRKRKAELVLAFDGSIEDVETACNALGLTARFVRKQRSESEGTVWMKFELIWRSSDNSRERIFVPELEKRFRLLSLEVIGRDA
ncbi:MgtC/SapB family protein [Rhizobium sp. B230/85]|nr:MgtC/SapB family protein [Rhizobium sp. B209b/85]QXZ99104.1 MgtC/SapB family protein [Rhizobium sp. B230/85]